MSSRFCRFHVLIRQHFITQRHCDFRSLSSPHQINSNSKYQLSYFLLYFFFELFVSTLIVHLSHLLAVTTHVSQLELSLPVSLAFLFKVPVLSHFFIIKGVFENILKLKLTQDTLCPTIT